MPHALAHESGRRPGGRLLRLGMALACAVLGSIPASAAEGPGPGPVAGSSAGTSLVSVESGRVTVDLENAEVADVLAQIAARCGFQLKTSGPLGRVTAAFTNLSPERALRRLVQDHELMLVYGKASGAPGTALVEVAVFAAPPSRRAADWGGAEAIRERVALLAEIDRLTKAGGDAAGLARLAELLDTAPDPTIRVRAALALGRVGGAGAAAALAGALSDQAPRVRVQAAHALRTVEAARSIPALGGLLLGDPDVTVRRAAAHLLAGMSDPAAMTALSGAARDPDATVREAVTRALERGGRSVPR